MVIFYKDPSKCIANYYNNVTKYFFFWTVYNRRFYFRKKYDRTLTYYKIPNNPHVYQTSPKQIMKITSISLLLTTFLFSISAPAANITINLVGSSALRSSVHPAILANLGAPVYAYTDTGSNGFNNAIYSIIRGSFGSDTYTVRCCWSGSVTGIEYVCSLTTTRNCFLPTTTTMHSYGNNLGNITPTDAGVPDAAIATIFESSTTSTDTLDDRQVGVAPFMFLANKGSTITNMTSQAFRAIYGAGVAVKSLFTGNIADRDTYIYGVGLNGSSGARAIAMAETGYGIFKAVQQYTVTTSGGTLTAVNYITDPGGYSDGGALTAALSNTSDENDPNVGIVVGYAGIADVTADNVQLTYNGVAYSADAVYSGQYTFWSYSHVYTSARIYGATSGDDLLRKNWITYLGNTLLATPGAAGLDLSLMKVNRAGDGGDVNRNGNP